MTDDQLFETKLRATLDEAIPKLVVSQRHVVPVQPARQNRPWRSLALVGTTTAVLIAGGALLLSQREPAEKPPSTTGVAETSETTGASTTTATTEPLSSTTVPEPTDTTVTPTTVPQGFGLVAANDSIELGEGEAEAWGRRYLNLLAQGDYESAAVLLAADGYTSRFSANRDDLAPAATQASDQLPQQLRDYCESDGLCLPVYDIVPNDLALLCATDEPCDATERAVYDSVNDGWMFRFSFSAEDGSPAKFDPSSAGPITAHIVVGATDGQVYVRWVPPSPRNGDPALWLPPMQIPTAPTRFEVDLPEGMGRFSASTDGANLCVAIDGGSMCTDPLAPPHGFLAGGIGSPDEADDYMIQLFVVAGGVTVEMRNPESGEPYEFIDRIETTVGDVTAWLFQVPRGGGLRYRLTFTLPIGATFESVA